MPLCTAFRDVPWVPAAIEWLFVIMDHGAAGGGWVLENGFITFPSDTVRLVVFELTTGDTRTGLDR